MSQMCYRKTLLALIRFLGDSESQFEYERNVQIANVPAELICMWFDDSYHPDTELFRESFSGEEREILASFNRFFDGRVSSMPDGGGVSSLLESLEWLEIMSQARLVFERLK